MTGSAALSYFVASFLTRMSASVIERNEKADTFVSEKAFRLGIDG